MNSANAFPARLSAAAALLCFCGWAAADTAKMLPEGKSRLRYQLTYGSADSRFDDGGRERSFSEINEARLAKAGLSAEVPGVYRIGSDGESTFTRHDIYYEYGITEHLGLGVWANYQQLEYTGSAHLTEEAGWPMLTDVQRAAVSGATETLDRADLSTGALGDTVVGFKHRLYGDNHSRNRFAYWLGIRLPTGHVADPREAELSTGDGQTDLGVWFAFDHEPVEHLLLSLHTRHEYQLPGERDVSDPAAPGEVIAMEFQPGFHHFAELLALYTAPRPTHNYLVGIRTSYDYEGKERRQDYDPASGSYRGGLDAVDGTDSNIWRVQPELGLNLFPSRIPASARLYYSWALDGKNALAADYAGLRLDLFW